MEQITDGTASGRERIHPVPLEATYIALKQSSVNESTFCKPSCHSKPRGMSGDSPYELYSYHNSDLRQDSTLYPVVFSEYFTCIVVVADDTVPSLVSCWLLYMRA